METQSVITVYTRPDCTYSDALIDELDKQGTNYIAVDLLREPERIPELTILTGGERITPVMVAGSVVTVGFRGAG